MPTYRYRCERCGDELDVWQSFSEDPLSTHDDPCGGRLVRVLTPAGIVLKGSGFYKTDSRTNGARGKDRERAKESSDSSTSGAKPDSKPDRGSGSGGSKESPASAGSSGTGSSGST